MDRDGVEAAHGHHGERPGHRRVLPDARDPLRRHPDARAPDDEQQGRPAGLGPGRDVHGDPGGGDPVLDVPRNDVLQLEDRDRRGREREERVREQGPRLERDDHQVPGHEHWDHLDLPDHSGDRERPVNLAKQVNLIILVLKQLKHLKKKILKLF